MKSSFPRALLGLSLVVAVAAFAMSCSISTGGPKPCPLTGVSNSGCCVGIIPCPAPEFLYVTALHQVVSYSVDLNTGVPSMLASVAGPNMSGGVRAVAGAGGEFVYVSDLAGNLIDGFTSNAGILTPIPGSPFGGVSGPAGLADNGKFLFVPNSTSNTVTVFTIAQNGALGAVPGSPFPAGSGPKAAASDFTRFLYVSNFTDAMGSISGYAVDPNMGALTALPGPPFPTQPNAGPAGLVAGFGNGVDFLYVALTNANSVAGFSIDRTSGALAPLPGSPFATGSGPVDVAANPNLYAADGNANAVSGFSFASNGSLTPLAGSPFLTGMTPSHLVLDGRGHLYVTNSGGNSFSGFSIDFLSGALTPLNGSPFNAGTQPTGIAVGH